jgi:hypothetical protein
MALTTLQCNSNEDLFLPDGRNLAILSGQNAVLQCVRQRTKMRLGENIFNVNEGVDYFGSIFSSPPDFDSARKSISDAILSCPDVVSIEQLSISISGNRFSYVANIITIYGNASVSNQPAA